jgi:hypothetical protein
MIILQTLPAGYFHKNSYVRIKKGKTLNRSITLDTYLGGGDGETRHNYYGDPLRAGRLKINFVRGFVHGGFRYDSGRLLKIGLALKFSYTDYLVSNKFSYIPLSEQFVLENLISADGFSKLDFSPKIGIGNDYINIYITSTINSGPNVLFDPEFILNTFIGTEFNFTQWSKKRKAKK